VLQLFCRRYLRDSEPPEIVSSEKVNSELVAPIKSADPLTARNGSGQSHLVLLFFSFTGCDASEGVIDFELSLLCYLQITTRNTQDRAAIDA